MKILVPTDFSNTSCGAAQWASDFLRKEEVAILEIVHCLNIRNRSDMFTKLDDILKERAVLDLTTLEEVLKKGEESSLQIESSIFKVDPKTFLPAYARKIGADLIVVGSNGLTPAKEMTIGSVAHAVSRKSTVPVLIIPPDVSYHSPKTLVLAMGQDKLNAPEILNHISKVMEDHLEKVFVVHVERSCPEEFPKSTEEQIREALPELMLEFHCEELDGSIIETVNKFAGTVDGDMISLIHHPRGWLGRLLEPSIAKEAIYNLKRPLLILKDERDK